MFRPWSAAEDADLSARAAEMPGTQQWSRLARIGHGLQVRQDGPGESSIG